MCTQATTLGLDKTKGTGGLAWLGAATVLTALGAVASAQSPIGGAGPRIAQPGVRSGDQQDMTGSLNMSATGEIFLANGSPAYVGFAWRFDPLPGDWVFGKQIIADMTLNQVPSLHEEFHLLNVLDSQTTNQSSSSSFSITASTMLIKAAASLQMSSSSGSSMTEDSFILEWIREYGPSVADFSTLQLSTDALATLDEIAALPPEDRAAEWLTNFGTHVAVGYRSRASIQLKISLKDSSSFVNSSTYAAIRATYKAVSGSADIASAMEQAMRHSFLEVNVTGIGVDLSTITFPTTVAQIDDPGEKQTLLAQITAAMNASHSADGLLLIPSYTIPGAPIFSLASFEHPAVGLATTSAHHGIEAVVRADGFTTPASPGAVLEEQPAFSAGLQSLADEIEAARRALVEEFDALWNEFYRYLSDPSASNATLLSTQATATNTARIALEALLDDVDAYTAAGFPLKSMQVLSVNWWGGNCGVPGDYQVDVKMENVALFCRDQLDTIAEQLIRRLRILHSWPSTNITPGGFMQPGAVFSVMVISSAPSAVDPGLRDITFRIVSSLQFCWTEVRVEFEDDFSRDFTALTLKSTWN